MTGHQPTPLAVMINSDLLPEEMPFRVTTHPPECDHTTLRQLLLERLFAVDEDVQRDVISALDLRTKPDLLDCYQVLVLAFQQWEAGLNELRLSNHDRAVDPDAPWWHCVDQTGPTVLDLHLTVEHDPVGWAVRNGYASCERTVWDWLRAMTLVWLVDRHEVRLPLPDQVDDTDASRVLRGLMRGRILTWGPDGHTTVSPRGRDVITALLTETNALVSDFDIYQDVRWNSRTQETEFDTGRGADLRVPVMMSHGTDPLRGVFLMRLYDGTLDEYADYWQRAISTETLTDLLLPVVDRQLPEPPLEIMTAIMADGEDRQQAAVSPE